MSTTGIISSIAFCTDHSGLFAASSLSSAVALFSESTGADPVAYLDGMQNAITQVSNSFVDKAAPRRERMSKMAILERKCFLVYCPIGGKPWIFPHARRIHVDSCRLLLNEWHSSFSFSRSNSIPFALIFYMQRKGAPPSCCVGMCESRTKLPAGSVRRAPGAQIRSLSSTSTPLEGG